MTASAMTASAMTASAMTASAMTASAMTASATTASATTASAMTASAMTAFAMPAFAMPAFALPADCPDAIGFARLHALVARGYRPQLGVRRADDGHVCIPFTHPRAHRRKSPPPPITLWSDGIVSTTGLLWPEKFVPSDDPPPDWQRFIMPEDATRFASFVDSVARPDLVDLHLKPLWLHAKVFVTRLIFGSTLCALIGFAGKLALAEI